MTEGAGSKKIKQANTSFIKKKQKYEAPSITLLAPFKSTQGGTQGIKEVNWNTYTAS